MAGWECHNFLLCRRGTTIPRAAAPLTGGANGEAAWFSGQAENGGARAEGRRNSKVPTTAWLVSKKSIAWYATGCATGCGVATSSAVAPKDANGHSNWEPWSRLGSVSFLADERFPAGERRGAPKTSPLQITIEGPASSLPDRPSIYPAGTRVCRVISRIRSLATIVRIGSDKGLLTTTRSWCSR